MRQILQVPNPILHAISRPVENIDAYIWELCDEMERFISSPDSIGISAIQLGEKVRVIAVKRNEEKLFIINPVITKSSSQIYPSREGCLSIGLGREFYWVRRHKIVKVTGLNLDGARVSYKGREQFGAVLQHEIDHLGGILIMQKGKRSA